MLFDRSDCGDSSLSLYLSVFYLQHISYNKLFSPAKSLVPINNIKTINNR